MSISLFTTTPATTVRPSAETSGSIASNQGGQNSSSIFTTTSNC